MQADTSQIQLLEPASERLLLLTASREAEWQDQASPVLQVSGGKSSWL